MPFIESFDESLPAWLKNDLADANGENGIGGGFMGIVFSLMADIVGFAATVANRGALLKDRLLCVDVVPKHAWERSMPRYYGETAAAHAARLADAWDAYRYPGRLAIIGQMGLYGFGAGVAIYDAYDWPAEPPVGPLSQFWVVVAAGYHPFHELLVGSGDAIVGDDMLVGITGIATEQIDGIKALIRKWKPVQWVCREVRFDLGGGDYAAFQVQPYSP